MDDDKNNISFNMEEDNFNIKTDQSAPSTDDLLDSINADNLQELATPVRNQSRPVIKQEATSANEDENTTPTRETVKREAGPPSIAQNQAHNSQMNSNTPSSYAGSHLSHGTMSSGYSNSTGMSSHQNNANIASWQNHGFANYSNMDSGINTANNTGPPSIATASRIGSEMPRNYKQGNYTPSVISSAMTDFSLPSMASTSAMSTTENSQPTTPQRPRNGQNQQNQHSNHQNPNSMPTTPSSRHHPDQNEMTVEDVHKLLPELLRLLHDEDEEVFTQASVSTQKLSKTPAGVQAIIESTNIVTALINLVGPKIERISAAQKAIAKTIYEISQYDDQAKKGIITLVKNGAIRALIILLSNQVPMIQSYAVTALHNILVFANSPLGRRMKNARQYDIRKMVREEGGTERLTCLLKSDNDKFLAICADSLFILAHNSPESKIRILQARGPEELIRIMANSTYLKLLNPVSRVLKVLSTCRHNKPEIVRLGGMQALGRHLANYNTQTAKLVGCCLWSLRNLSDVATKVENMDGVLKLLLERLNTKDNNIVQCAAGTLMNLTCNNSKNKLCVFQNNGVDILIRRAINCDDVNTLDPVLCCLRNLSCRHPEAYNAALTFRSHYGLPKITEMLQLSHNNNWNIIKPVISIIRNLVSNAKECQNLVRTLGCIPKLINLIVTAKLYLSTKGVPDRPWSTTGMACTVRPEDIVIASCDALLKIADDSLNRETMLGMGIIKILCDVLRHHVPNSENSILPQNKIYGLTLKQESHLAEEVCTAAGHVLLTMRRDDQARELCIKYQVNNTLDQFQRYLASKEQQKNKRKEIKKESMNSNPSTPVSSRNSHNQNNNNNRNLNSNNSMNSNNSSSSNENSSYNKNVPPPHPAGMSGGNLPGNMPNGQNMPGYPGQGYPPGNQNFGPGNYPGYPMGYPMQGNYPQGGYGYPMGQYPPNMTPQQMHQHHQYMMQQQMQYMNSNRPNSRDGNRQENYRP